MLDAMARKSRLKPVSVPADKEAVGQRLARIRKERGYTQVELAEKIGLIQALVSDYERGKLRLNAEMLTRFALTLEVSSDELLGIKAGKTNGRKPSRRVLRRLERIEALPPHQQSTLLKTIDTFLRGASAT
jgi:transcriptional regulator with XRE-family HTH domain